MRLRSKRLFARFCWASLLLFSSLSFASNQLEGIRIWPSPNKTRVVLDLKETPKYSYFSLQGPDRLVIDLASTDKNFDLTTIKNSGSLIKRVRYSKPKKNNAVRVVLELAEAATPKVFALPPTAPYLDRLVIDLSSKAKPLPKPVIEASKNNRSRDIIVAVDAGHGGEDPGSIGYKGSYEKNITLSVAKKLAKLIDAEPGMKATLTRTGDYYIPVRKRPQLARERKADLFVSVHADAFSGPGPSGASVWVLSTKRASSELGRWLEKREEQSELLGGVAEVIQETPNERYLTHALLDMSMDHSISTSYEVGREVIGQLRGVTKMHKKSPQAASFGMLTAPDIPSILVEVGFISNPKEEKNLNWAKHRQNLANSIFTAVKSYFKSSPPDGTLWARNKIDNRTHRVRSGDSLSMLAQRYNVRVRDIKQANNMSSDIVRIGQVLNIPST